MVDIIIGKFSCTLRKQQRERERQKIVSFLGGVTTLGLFHAQYVICTDELTWDMVTSRMLKAWSSYNIFWRSRLRICSQLHVNLPIISALFGLGVYRHIYPNPIVSYERVFTISQDGFSSTKGEVNWASQNGSKVKIQGEPRVNPVWNKDRPKVE